MKKNNKGFSLVELIVVVLIMGIIAVALAPQVMKWVQRARDNGDANTAKDLKASINSAIADALGDGKAIPTTSGTSTLTIDKDTVEKNVTNGVYSGTGNSYGEFCVYLMEVLGGDYPKTSAGNAFTCQIEEVKSGSYKVTVNK